MRLVREVKLARGEVVKSLTHAPEVALGASRGDVSPIGILRDAEIFGNQSNDLFLDRLAVHAVVAALIGVTAVVHQEHLALQMAKILRCVGVVLQICGVSEHVVAAAQIFLVGFLHGFDVFLVLAAKGVDLRVCKACLFQGDRVGKPAKLHLLTLQAVDLRFEIGKRIAKRLLVCGEGVVFQL